MLEAVEALLRGPEIMRDTSRREWVWLTAALALVAVVSLTVAVGRRTKSLDSYVAVRHYQNIEPLTKRSKVHLVVDQQREVVWFGAWSFNDSHRKSFEVRGSAVKGIKPGDVLTGKQLEEIKGRRPIQDIYNFLMRPR